MTFCVSSERPIEPLTLAVLREVDGLAGELGFSYFVAGATARDILLTGVFGIETGRATLDVDFAVAVRDWEHFDTIKAGLIGRGVFEAAPKAAQRLYYKPHAASSGYPLDLIPFGGVEVPPSTIAWPPEMKAIMNVAGYEEALATSLLVEVSPKFHVRVVSLPGLALLKLFAWADRGNDDPKDAADLATLLRNYEYVEGLDRLYEREIATLEAVDHDVALAFVRLLGADMRAIAMPSTLVQLDTLFNDADRLDRLALHMTRGLAGVDDAYETAQRLVDHFKAGALGEKDSRP